MPSLELRGGHGADVRGRFGIQLAHDGAELGVAACVGPNPPVYPRVAARLTEGASQSFASPVDPPRTWMYGRSTQSNMTMKNWYGPIRSSGDGHGVWYPT
jgi:hypothetical protein